MTVDDYDAAKDAHDRFRTLLHYEPVAGDLRWLFCREKPDAWNTRYAGRVAGHVNEHGYRVFHCEGKVLYVHRVVWCLMTGKWPVQIDHINGIRDDNRWENLRSVQPLDNRRNAARNRNNTSGKTGVSFDSRRDKWRASITIDRRHVALGAFKSKDDAIAARLAAEQRHAFHPNHGRAA